MRDPDTRRANLIAAGAEKLADALLALESHSEEATAAVDRLVATPDENIKRFKSQLSGLKRARRFVDWRGTSQLARKLSGLLVDLEEAEVDGKTGVELLGRFFETDRAVFERCDDSSGIVSSVFRHDASLLFARYAEACPDKAWLRKTITDLVAGNDYGARDYLLTRAGNFFGEADLRELANRFWQLAEGSANAHDQRTWYHGVEELAAHLGDAPLFEKARLAAWGEPGTAACLDIAEAYLNSGDPQTALAWVERDRDPGSFQQDKREQLLLAIYQELGESDKVTALQRRRFASFYCVERLTDLLAVIGEGQRDAVLAAAEADILRSESFKASQVEFLLEIDRTAAAEEYLLQHADQFNGDFYSSLLPLAKAMEKSGRSLAASLLYRALLDSILARARTKTYSHGVRYLKKLGSLAPAVDDWREFASHDDYLAGLRLAHGRKSSFWGRFEEGAIDR